MNNYKAFTMIETLIVLSCCSFFLFIPILAINSWHQQIKIEQFLSSFEKNILFAQQMSILKGSDAQILFDESKQEIDFYTDNRYLDNQLLIVPETLLASGPSKIIFKKSTGNNGNLSKYSFFWKNKNRKIEYQFQLGSGKFVKKIIEL